MKQLPISDRLFDYIVAKGTREAPVMKALRRATKRVPMAGMQVSPPQGALMALLVSLIGARKAIEVGVFTGYSSLAVALALPEDGRLVACDVSEAYTAIARRFWQKAGVSHKIALHLAPGLETLNRLLAAGEAGTYDFAFIDADKENYSAYYERVLKLLRPGGLVAIDNVLWGGSVANRRRNDASVRAIRALNDKVARDRRVAMCLVPIADGVTLAMKR
jgi:caffeoyl-CoA O-methyltransferase